MERYEVRVKFDEIRKLSDIGDYKQAMNIADTVDWDRVRNIGMLSVAGEVYERCRYYEDCRAIYERIYQIQPQSRINVYKLANVSVKLKDFDVAKEYLEEYKDIAPYDPNVIVLTYKIQKGQGADVSELIKILEKLKEKDYHEKWAYELAVMYAEAGEEEKCASECDNIFLWFGEGRYVYKALKLKSFFRTLTTAQENYIKNASRRPEGADETVRRAAEAADETEAKQSRFMELQKEAASADIGSEDAKAKLRDMEQARDEAIDAYREAKAAALLNEASSERELEEEAESETEDQQMLGEMKMPTFNLPVMEKFKAPVWQISEENADKTNNVPGMEFIDESENEQQIKFEDFGYTDVTDGSQEELSEYYGEEESPDMDLAEMEAAASVSEEEIPSSESAVKYDTMEELLTHADDMKSDDLANSLAALISGKGEAQDRADARNASRGVSSSKSIQNVINRIWTRSAVRKSSEASRYEVDPLIDGTDDIEVETMTPSRYDTLNLQKDLANSINHILNATDKSEIDKTIAVMDRRMLKNNILKYAEASGKDEPEEESKEVLSEMIEESFDTDSVDAFEQKKEKIFDVLEQEIDGQIRLIMEMEVEDTDIPGQINIEDYIHEQEQAQLEEAKKQAIRIAGDYMEQVTKAVPYIAEEEAKVYLADSQKELLERARNLMESNHPDPEEIDSVMKSLTMMTAYANEKASDHHEGSIIDAAVEAKAVVAAVEGSKNGEPVSEESEEIYAEPEAESREVPELIEADVEAGNPAEAEESDKTEGYQEVEESSEAEESGLTEEPASEDWSLPEIEETDGEIQLIEQETEDQTEAEKEPENSRSTGYTKNLTEDFSKIFSDQALMPGVDQMAGMIEESMKIEDTPEEQEKDIEIDDIPEEQEKDIEMDDIPEEQEKDIEPEISDETREMMSENKEKLMDSIADIAPKEVDDLDKEEAKTQVVPMNDQQWEIMDYFMNVPEIEKQIADFIEKQHDRFTNIAVCGSAGSGRASLALRLYKSIRVNNSALPNQTLKVDADSLNRKSVAKIYEKIGKGIVLIEHAGMLSEVAATELTQAMIASKGSIFTILVANTERMEKLFEAHKDLKELIQYRFVIPEYNMDQFVDFGKNYALSYGYVIDDIAQLAFYSAISAKKTKNRLVTLQDVKYIINEAILNNESRSNKLFRGLGSKNKDRDGNIILREKDFM